MTHPSLRFVVGGMLAATLGCGQDGNPVAPTTPTTPTNQAPQASAIIPDQTVAAGGDLQLDVQGHFADPDGDLLAFRAASSDPDVATASVAGSIVTIWAMSPGMAEITVTAADPAGLTASQHFTATTEPPTNRAPRVAAPILGRTLKLNQSEKATIDLNNYFTDPDGDPLTFEVSSGDNAVATASVSNGTATLLAVALGTTAVTVAARDLEGLSATHAFSVTVEQGTLSAELEVTNCHAEGVGFVDVTVEGTVRAVTPLSSARVTAYMDTQTLGEQVLGDLGTGETRAFLIRGSATVTASSRCRVELSAAGSSMTAVATVSFR